MDHTYRYNRPYARAIVPAGQTYGGTSSSDIARFRQVAAAQQSTGVNWWDWESASASNWDAVGAALGPFAGTPPSSDYALVTRGANNDLVRWAQEHLQSAGQQLTVDGDFGPATETAVRNFQTANGLPVSGQLDTATWRVLTDRYDPAPQLYTKRAKVLAAAGGQAPPARYEIPRVDGPRPLR
jgi:murein L,D-transpeptidase YcbB/YkuD